MYELTTRVEQFVVLAGLAKLKGREAMVARRDAGQLLLDCERGKAGRPKKDAPKAPISEYQTALKKGEVDERTSKKWQEIASLRKEDFLVLLEAASTVLEVRDAGKKWKLVMANPEVKARMTDGSGMSLDEAYAELGLAKVKAKRKKKLAKDVEDHPAVVAAYLKALKALNKLEVREQAVEAARQHLFSPDAQQFVRNAHDSIRSSFILIEEHFNA